MTEVVVARSSGPGAIDTDTKSSGAGSRNHVVPIPSGGRSNRQQGTPMKLAPFGHLRDAERVVHMMKFVQQTYRVVWEAIPRAVPSAPL